MSNENVFIEQEVEAKPEKKDIGLLVLLVAAAVVCIVPGMFFISYFGIILAALVIFLDYYFIFPKLRLCYEYTMVRDEIDIAAIYSGQSRKEKLTVDLKEAELICPAGSSLCGSMTADRSISFASGRAPSEEMAFYLKGSSGRICVILEPDDRIRAQIRACTKPGIYREA